MMFEEIVYLNNCVCVFWYVEVGWGLVVFYIIELVVLGNYEKFYWVLF